MIIARTRHADPTSEERLEMILALRETPFPGDTINTRDGRRIIVIRRSFNELTSESEDTIDVELGVRIA